MSNDNFEFEIFETINTNIKVEEQDIVENEIPDVLVNVHSTEDNSNLCDIKNVLIQPEADCVNVPLQYVVQTKEEVFEITEQTVDPLQQKRDEKLDFEWLYKDEDIFDDDYGADALLPSKAKRARSTLKAPSGLVWSTEKILANLPASAPTIFPKTKGPAKVVTHPLESWVLFLDEPILKIVLKHTNDAIRKCRGNAAYQKPADIVELRAWFGLKYLCGIFRNAKNNGPLDELWSLELGNAVFRGTMSFKRYKFLSANMRLTEINGRDVGQFNSIQNVLEKFLINCRSYYAPSNICAVNEHKVSFGNDLDASFVVLSDTKTTYLCNGLLDVAGKRTDASLVQLICDIKGTKRCVCLGEDYESIKLAKKLFKRDVCVLCAIQRDSADLPKDLQVCKTLYAPDLSLTLDSNNKCVLACGLAENISAIKLQSVIEKCCETFQQCSKAFSTSSSSFNETSPYTWQLNFLHCLLDFAAMNAWTILRLSEKFSGDIDQRDFQRKLGLYLTQQQLQRRLHRKNNLTLIQKLHICELLGESTEELLCKAADDAKKFDLEGVISKEAVAVPEGTVLYTKLIGKRQRCRGCPSKSGNKTRFRCQQCKVCYCNKHLVSRCYDCTGFHQQPTADDSGVTNATVL